MKNEKIRLRVDSLLLGERRFSRLVVLVPRLLRVLSAVLILLALPQIGVLYYSFPVLGVMYVFAAVMLRVLLWCAELLRDRWFMCRIKGMKLSASSLLADFSFADIFRAALLAVTLRLRCIGRGAGFFALPLLCLALSFYLVSSGISSAVLAALVCGNFLFLAAAWLFSSAALSSVRFAVKLTAFEKSGLAVAVNEKIAVLDSCCLRLLGLRVLSGGFFSAEKIMAGMVFSEKMLSGKTDNMLINCKHGC